MVTTTEIVSITQNRAWSHSWMFQSILVILVQMSCTMRVVMFDSDFRWYQSVLVFHFHHLWVSFGNGIAHCKTAELARRMKRVLLVIRFLQCKRGRHGIQEVFLITICLVVSYVC